MNTETTTIQERAREALGQRRDSAPQMVRDAYKRILDYDGPVDERGTVRMDGITFAAYLNGPDLKTVHLRIVGSDSDPRIDSLSDLGLHLEAQEYKRSRRATRGKAD